MNIILSRHGNTFAPNEPAVWVGNKNDLPLVDAGIEQAKKLGVALKHADIPLHAVYCSPLQRTIHYAQITLQEMNASLNPTIDPRLDELDYGQWTGLTTDQVREQFGANEIDAWENHQRWPLLSGWDKTEHQVQEEVESFAADLVRKHKPHENILIVTSNGKMRYFLKLIPGEYEKKIRDQTIKVKTGYICKLGFQNDWQLHCWNKAPSPELF